MSSNLDRLFKDVGVIINEASLDGISREYSIKVQQCTTKVMFDTNANVSVMSQKLCNSLPQKPKLLKPDTCTMAPASGTDLEPVGQCYLNFRLGNKYFTDQFVIL